MKRRALTITFLCVLCAGAAAQAATVTYVDGPAAVRGAAGWVDLAVGDGLAADARLRLSKEAYVELDAAGARIILSRPGGYVLSALLSTNRTLDAAHAGASLSTALARMVKGSVVKQSAVMGVLGKLMPASGDEQRQMQAERIARAQEQRRMTEMEGVSQGSEADEGPAIAAAPPPAAAAAPPPAAASEFPAKPAAPQQSLTVPSSPAGDNQQQLETGKLLIAAGEYDRAIDTLMDALGSATEEQMPEVRYYLAFARSASGDTREALKLIDGLEAPRGADWALDYAIFKAKMLADSNAFAEELSWLAPFGPTLSKDADRAAVYYFLLGVGYRGTGNAKLARQNLSKVVSISPKSEVGAAAAQLLATK